MFSRQTRNHSGSERAHSHRRTQLILVGPEPLEARCALSATPFGDPGHFDRGKSLGRDVPDFVQQLQAADFSRLRYDAMPTSRHPTAVRPPRDGGESHQHNASPQSLPEALSVAFKNDMPARDMRDMDRSNFGGPPSIEHIRDDRPRQFHTSPPSESVTRIVSVTTPLSVAAPAPARLQSPANFAPVSGPPIRRIEPAFVAVAIAPPTVERGNLTATVRSAATISSAANVPSRAVLEAPAATFSRPTFDPQLSRGHAAANALPISLLASSVSLSGESRSSDWPFANLLHAFPVSGASGESNLRPSVHSNTASGGYVELGKNPAALSRSVDRDIAALDASDELAEAWFHVPLWSTPHASKTPTDRALAKPDVPSQHGGTDSEPSAAESLAAPRPWALDPAEGGMIALAVPTLPATEAEPCDRSPATNPPEPGPLAAVLPQAFPRMTSSVGIYQAFELAETLDALAPAAATQRPANSDSTTPPDLGASTEPGKSADPRWTQALHVASHPLFGLSTILVLGTLGRYCYFRWESPQSVTPSRRQCLIRRALAAAARRCSTLLRD